MIKFLKWFMGLFGIVHEPRIPPAPKIAPQHTSIVMHLRLGLTRKQLSPYYHQACPNGHVKYLDWLREVVEHYELIRPLTGATTDELAQFLDARHISYQVVSGLCRSEWMPELNKETTWLRLSNGLYVMGVDKPLVRHACFFPEQLWEVYFEPHTTREHECLGRE